MMGNKTKIEWTRGDDGVAGTTWNPIRGCSRTSSGCEKCYAERVAARFSGPGLPYEGLAVIKNGEARWTGEVRMVPEHLGDPLRWKRPRRIFVNSMSDLFHEALTNEQIASVFGVMAAAPQHTFQILTKRAERMRDWFRWVRAGMFVQHAPAVRMQLHAGGSDVAVAKLIGSAVDRPWPLSNVHLGVSCEDQKTADERIPLLLDTPSAIRWISAEPLLESVTLPGISKGLCPEHDGPGFFCHGPCPFDVRLNWVVIGSESGPGARPMDIAWAKSIVEQCQAAGVAVFTKQIANAKDKKGGNPEHWPPGNWPREFPAA